VPGFHSPRSRSTHAGLVRLLPVAAAVLLVAPTGVAGKSFAAWGSAVPESGVNTAAAEGCPIESPDGLSLYIASNRAGGTGSPDPNDIWVFHRASIDGPWGPAENLGQPVNSTFADYCPTPLRGKSLLFVSTRPGGCGGGDIYLARNSPARGWSVQNLGCASDGTGPNFPGGEFGPSLVETDEGTYLFFSSDGYTPGGPQDIYMSRRQADGSFAPATAVAELNSSVSDFMPNVRKDGLEIVFNSNRAGGFGGQDVYTASRASTADPWSAPVNLGSAVNTSGNETRSSLSWDGLRLHFGRDGDIYVSSR
jgi:Tol biopolymer transport system component